MLQFHDDGTLTTMSSNAAHDPHVESIRADARRPSVLIVEDDVIIAIDMELAFEDAGFDIVGPAADEAEALELIAKHEPDFAALDWNLRTGTSAHIAEALNAIGARFVFVTGARNEVAYDGPSAEIFAKPADPRLLMQALAA